MAIDFVVFLAIGYFLKPPDAKTLIAKITMKTAIPSRMSLVMVI